MYSRDQLRIFSFREKQMERGRMILKVTANCSLKVQLLVGSNCKWFGSRWLIVNGVKFGYLGCDTP